MSIVGNYISTWFFVRVQRSFVCKYFMDLIRASESCYADPPLSSDTPSSTARFNKTETGEFFSRSTADLTRI